MSEKQIFLGHCGTLYHIVLLHHIVLLYHIVFGVEILVWQQSSS